MRLPLGTVVVVLSAVLGCSTQRVGGDGLDARAIELGTSTAELIAWFGPPLRTSDATAGERTFRTFYYPNNLVCVVDLGSDVVCKVSVGETDGYCYP
jgi:hypothetical protein